MATPIGSASVALKLDIPAYGKTGNSGTASMNMGGIRSSGSKGAVRSSVNPASYAMVVEDRALPSWCSSPNEVFSYYDREHDNFINKNEFACAIRACGGGPTQKQVSAYWREMAEEEAISEATKKTVVAGRLGVKRHIFLENIERILTETQKPARSEIFEALKTFTKQSENNQGMILELETIKMVLGGMGGDHLGPLDVEMALSGLEHKPGQIHIGQFLDILSGQQKFRPTPSRGMSPTKLERPAQGEPRMSQASYGSIRTQSILSRS